MVLIGLAAMIAMGAATLISLPAGRQKHGARPSGAGQRALAAGAAGALACCTASLAIDILLALGL